MTSGFLMRTASTHSRSLKKLGVLATLPLTVLSIHPLLVQEKPGHETSKLPPRHDPVTLEILDERLQDIVRAYESRYSSLPRVAIYDSAFPATVVEYLALNKYAVLLLTVITQDAAELPLKRIYVRCETGESGALQIAAAYYWETKEGSRIRQMLGRYRVDVFCLVPIATLLSPGAVAIDFARNREGFVVVQLPHPEKPRAEFIASDSDRIPLKDRSVDRTALQRFLTREFPQFRTGQFSAQPPSGQLL